MSHQTGIKANDKLNKFFSTCREGKIRIIKVSIENEELVLSSYKEIKSTWEKDYNNMILPLIEENLPCYLIYRLDSKSTSGYDWLFISWIPDIAIVRQKMLYASTKATLKQEFGTAHIKDELHATVKDDITFNGYQLHKKAAVAPVPLTTREEELEELRRSELTTCTNFSVDSRQQTLSGVAFPTTKAVQEAILEMIIGSYDYLQFKIDLNKEEIHLVTSSNNLHIKDLPSKVPEDCARYHLYKFKHTHEGDYLENIVFIYSMPGYDCTIKERMLYSSCKGPFLSLIQELGLDIVKKLEIESGSELTEEYLQDEIHPKKNIYRPKFAKPKGPPNRGAKRMTKTQINE